jgi:hypothetical protein
MRERTFPTSHLMTLNGTDTPSQLVAPLDSPFLRVD